MKKNVSSTITLISLLLLCISYAQAGDNNTPVPIPEPSTFVLLFTGLMGAGVSFIKRRYNELRRIFDILISAIALILTAPVMLVCAVLIKLDSPGPVFYKQVRVGMNRRSRKQHGIVEGNKRKENYFGAPFTIYKLRTMRTDAEKNGPVWAKLNDNRVTRLGKFLRKTRLDEIPQFINVLKGDMSIVGPRPERPVFVKDLSANIHSYPKRFRMKPGITGLAQTQYQYASSVEDTKKKLKYDLLYVKRACLYMDTKICFDTISTVIFAKGAR